MRDTPMGRPRSYDSSVPFRLRDVWRHRGLLARLAERDLKVKYQRSALGFLWTLGNPLVTVALLWTVFGQVVRIDIPAYWAFLLSGYFVFSFTVQMLNTAGSVLRDQSRLLKSACFPAELPLLAATVARLFEFGVAMGLVLLVLGVAHHGAIPIGLLVLPLLMLLQLLIVLGVAMMVSVLAVYFYDVEHALPVVGMMLFYASPVFYPAEMVPEGFQTAYFLNPLAGLLTLYHTALYEGRLPSLGLLAWVACVGVGLFWVGHALFRRHREVCVELV